MPSRAPIESATPRPSGAPAFSLVINTLNRADSLRRTLESFSWLDYRGAFEVIVVNGPSTDHTEKVLDQFDASIRRARCPEAVLSMSRNIGIAMASGEIVAFIDDDAIPEAEWLTQLAEAFSSPDVGGAGGTVFDQTGYSFQYQYSTATRLGNANWAAKGPAAQFCFPGSYEFPYLQGTNAAFRRTALLEIGGFDEEIEFYLDETEVCCRMVDAGYLIRQLPNAFVHHKFAPSHVRDTNRITRYRYPVLKNKIYFSLRHGRDYHALEEILDDNRRFVAAHRQDVEFHVVGGRLEASEHTVFSEQSERAWQVGLVRGLADAPRLITSETIEAHRGSFLPFPAKSPDGRRLTIALISRDYPPNHSGGIATLTINLATGLAGLGHNVHVIAGSSDINRVDFEAGVWVHRMLVAEHPRSDKALELAVPQHIWNWSATALQEVRRIATHHSVDLIEAPVWDCEGIAPLLDGSWPTVTSLHTPLLFWLDTNGHFAANRDWMESFGKPMLDLERFMMSKSQGIRANSSAIARDIEARYKFSFDPSRLCRIPHGMLPPRPIDSAVRHHAEVEILFVGRLEARKGIDVLLQAVPDVCERVPSVRFRIVGDKSLTGPDGKTYEQGFLSDARAKACRTQVVFEGRLDDEMLDAAYASCDILVSPSRYESFGLIFVEAMRYGKPVVGCGIGGMPEVITQGVDGILVPPGDAASLADALVRLAEDQPFRLAMGQAASKTFEARFTASRMAQDSIRFYGTLLSPP